MVNLDSEWMRHCGGVGRAKRHFDRAAARDNQEVVEMRNQQSGFTLIELVAVIVILGALAVVALPRFIDLQGEADEAAVQGVAGGLGSASALNLAGAIAGDADATTVTDCNDIGPLLQGGLPGEYTIPSQTISSNTRGIEADCNVQTTNGNFDATFTGLSVPTP